MKTRQVHLANYNLENPARTGEFVLLPNNNVAPKIVTQPSFTISQKSWVTQIVNGSPHYKFINPSQNIFIAVAGTVLQWEVILEGKNFDSSEPPDNIRYVWKKDGKELFKYNIQNNGAGTNIINILSYESNQEASGQYICEISNELGSVETEPLNLLIIDRLNNDFFYKNLLLNGDGDGGLDGWVASPDILTRLFEKDSSRANYNFGSLYKMEWPMNYETAADPTIYPNSVIQRDFVFSQGGHETLFYPIWSRARELDPSIADTNSPGTLSSVVGLGYQGYIARAFPPQIILNEDYETTGQFAGFFPGMRYIDEFNKNTADTKLTPGLFEESKNRILSYFTRDKIKFLKYDGSTTTQFSQTVDLSNYIDLINGEAYGVNSVRSHFFGYVGAGITRYQIKATLADNRPTTLNWYILSSEDFLYYIIENTEPAGPDEVPGRPLFSPISLQPGTPIEIIPFVDDRTIITIDYLDRFENVLQTEVIDGPDETDVFAIKEKAFLPLSMYPISQFFEYGWEAFDAIYAFNQGRPRVDLRNYLIPYIDGAQNVQTGLNNALSSNQTGTQATLDQKITTFRNFLETTIGIERLGKTDLNTTNEFYNQNASTITFNDLLDIYLIGSYDIDYFDTVDLPENFERDWQPATFYPEATTNAAIMLRIIRDMVELGETRALGAIGLNEPIQSNPLAGLAVVGSISVSPVEGVRSAYYQSLITNNPIKIFGQTYTTLDALRGIDMIYRTDDERVAAGIPATFKPRDRNVNYFVKKYDMNYYGIAIPTPQYPSVGTSNKGLDELGASAMFGVEKLSAVPKNTTAARITVTFKHSSPAIQDKEPEYKGWTAEEIYADLYGSARDYSEKIIEYGNPRCGITKMKFMLMPDRQMQARDNVTYFLPPSQQTVLGIAKDLLLTDTHDTSDPGQFTYRLIRPEEVSTVNLREEFMNNPTAGPEGLELTIEGLSGPNRFEPTPTSSFTQSIATDIVTPRRGAGTGG